MIELLTWAGIGFILTLAVIGLLSQFFFPLFLELNNEINEKFKDEPPSK
jgi:hypothetical protein